MPPLPPPAPSKRRAPATARGTVEPVATTTKSVNTRTRMTTSSTRTAAKPTEDDDVLVQDLSNLHISTATKAVTRRPLASNVAASNSRPPPPSKTTTTTSTTLTRKRHVPAASTTASSSSSNLAPSTTKSSTSTAPTSKGQSPSAREEEDLSPLQRVQRAKAAINAATKALSDISKTGWKGETSPALDKASTSAGRALAALRAIVAQEGEGGGLGIGRFEIERGANAVVTTLVGLEAYALALSHLLPMRASLISLWTTSTPTPAVPLTAPGLALSVPLPPPTYFHLTLTSALSSTHVPPSDLIPLVLSLQQFLLGCLFRSPDLLAKVNLKEVEQGLGSVGGPLGWRRMLDDKERLEGREVGEAARKKADAVCVSMFGVVIKGCVGLEETHSPPLLLSLRMSALFLLAETPLPPSRLASFYDQLRRQLLLFGRSCEKSAMFSPVETARLVVKGFEDARAALGAKGLVGDGEEGKEDVEKKWVELCEVVVHVARRGNDFAAAERISQLLDQTSASTSTSSSSGSSTSTAIASLTTTQVAAQVVTLSNKLASCLPILTTYFDKGDSTNLASFSRQAVEAIRRLTLLRSRPPGGSAEELSASKEVNKKIDAVIEKVRYAVVKGLKGGKRLDGLMRKERGEGVEESEEEKEVRAVLEGVVGSVETLKRAGASTEFSLPHAVECLVLLAYRHFILSDRATYQASFSYLERASVLLGATFTAPTSTISAIPFSASNCFEVSLLATAYYNFGGWLYNDGRQAETVRFARRACEVLSAVVTESEVTERVAEIVVVEKEMDETVKGFKAVLGKRFELLALALQAIGQKAPAYEAYGSAIAHQPIDVLIAFASSTTPSESPLSRMITRATRLGTFDLLLPGSSVSKRHRVEGKLSPAVVGALLEAQVVALEPCVEKKEAEAVIASLVSDLLAVYDAETHPLRRAKALLRSMQHKCEGSQGGVLDLSLEVAAQEIEKLCSRLDIGNDSHLRPFAQQYIAFSHLWLGFHAYRARQSTSCSVTVAEEARAVLRVLRKAYDGDIVPSPSAPRIAPTSAPKVSPKAAPKTATRRVPVAATKPSAFKTPQGSRTMPRSRAAANAVLVTPPSRGAIDLSDRVAALKLTDVKTVALDDVEKCFAQLETMADLLGMLGLSLVRISFLQFLRRLSSKLGPKAPSVFVAVSAQLGEEYVQLGKTARGGIVFAQADQKIQQTISAGNLIDPISHVGYLTAYAHYLASIGNQDRSARAYGDALELANTCAETAEGMSTTAQLIERTLVVQRASAAAVVSSVFHQRSGDIGQALRPALQALRLSHRAVSNINRLGMSDEPSDDTTPFVSASTDPRAPLSDLPSRSQKRQPIVRGTHAGLAWRLVKAFVTAILHVASLYSIQGVPKSAEHYAQQAAELATSLGSHRLLARCLIMCTEVRLRCGRTDEAEAALQQISALLGSEPCPEAIDAHRLEADLLMRKNQALDAHNIYTEAQQALDLFVTTATDPDHAGSPAKIHSPVAARTVTFKSMSPIISPKSAERGLPVPPTDVVLPKLQAYLLRVQATLFHMQNQHADGDALLRRLARLRVSEEDKAEEFKLLASLNLQRLLQQFAAQPLQGMLAGSVLSIPALSVTTTKLDSPRSSMRPAFTNEFQEIEKLLNRALGLSVARSEPSKLRELVLRIADLRALQCTTGRSKPSSAAAVSTVLELGSAVTLSREMLDAIDFKLGDAAPRSDILWPSLGQSAPATVLPADASRTDLYWASIRDRHRAESIESALTDPAMSAILPVSWTVVSLHLTAEKDGLILVRQRRDCGPVLFKLPFDRFVRRQEEGSDEEILTHEEALGMMREIIETNNAAASSAKNVEGKEETAEWWRSRRQLDGLLQNLLQKIEESWLGAFKTVFLDSRQMSSKARSMFKKAVDDILARSTDRNAGRTSTKKAPRCKLDDTILSSFAALPKDCRHEDLEDLYFYLIESFQVNGVSLAYDDTDVDQIVCDLRTVLEDMSNLPSSTSSQETSSATDSEGEHTFLILDKALQAFPWESIPCLRGRSVSRIPSLAFLRDRLDLAASLPKASSELPHQIVVNSSKASFVLNSAGDLARTQERFEPWLERMKDAGWSGITGRAPSEGELKSYLANQDLVMYFGHGGAEAYIRSTTIRHLPRCAVTMLWGCSSGFLKDQGDYDPTGTAYHYMIASCPALVANLWDVTDKDIDKFSQNVFKTIGLDNPPTSPREAPSTTLTEAVARSRDICNLKYLNGAAPVVYGIPVRFS